MPARKDMKAIHIRCEPALFDEAKEAADRAFEGNVAQFSRFAIRNDARLRRALGARYDIVIESLIGQHDVESKEAA
jgi:hypothetical protein